MLLNYFLNNFCRIEIMKKNGHNKALKYTEEHSHPRLFKLLGETALNEMNFQLAQRCFVEGGNYQGIQFQKRLLKIDVRF